MSEQQQEKTGTTAKTTDDRTSFAAYLMDIDRGRVESDATDLMVDAVKAVEATGKAAKVTITVTIAPQDPKTFDDTGILIVEGEAKATLPRVKRPASIFYATGDGEMTRNDPNRDDPRFD